MILLTLFLGTCYLVLGIQAKSWKLKAERKKWLSVIRYWLMVLSSGCRAYKLEAEGSKVKGERKKWLSVIDYWGWN